MSQSTCIILGFEKSWGLEKLCFPLFPYIYSLWMWSRADRAKLTPTAQVVFAVPCEVGARYTDPCTSEGCCQSKFLPLQHSENEQFWKFCFPRQSVARLSLKSLYFLETQEDFGLHSNYDSVEKLLLDMGCCSFVFFRDKFDLWKLASDFKYSKKGEHSYPFQFISIPNQYLILLLFCIIFIIVDFN